ncbi:MFS transporter [Cypionkella aquatica]|uniref:MFS transporter n=1 Tax=Cypionkella aquatica TaxID=1756042 RepID=A0AA37U098_9RHOB|nr:methyltransferase [Cypionkella aquatica]GLS87507.1 MFS transporter [Cypionkella aquatica]
MRSARLELALQSGALVLPAAGDILVLRPRAGDDLSALPQDRVVVKTGFKPDHDYFAAQGYRMQSTAPAAPVPAQTSPVALAIVCVPRAKAEARALLAEAMAADLIVVDGQKTDGVETLLKDCKALGLQVGEALSKAHGKLALITPAPALAAWTAQPSVVAGDFKTLPAVFSADGPDRGSELLVAALPVKLGNRVADLGAGWGYLSRAILSRDGVKELDLVEAEADALTCAQLNIPDPRARFHWADATSFKPARFWDAVVMNPPFHTAREADANLGMGFIKAAQRGLSPSGSLYMVANRHLPYDKLLVTLFKQVEEIGGDKSFRVVRASYPIRTR